MNAPDLRNAEFSALLEIAESRFHAWHLKELRPERDRRIDELKKQNLASGGRAVHHRRIYRELLEREVRERIGFYAAVAHESGNPEMLSSRRLEEYRDRIMTTVECAIGTLNDSTTRDARAAGDIPEPALPPEQRYIQLRAGVLDVVNAELRVLQAEGTLARHAETTAATNQASINLPQVEREGKSGPVHDAELLRGLARPTESATPKPDGKARKRGPKPDHQGAAQVADVVARVATDGDWRSRLDDVGYALDHGVCNASDPEHCEASNHEKIPPPRGWRQKGNNWVNPPDRATMVKAIEYRLEVAKQRTKTTPKTLS